MSYLEAVLIAEARRTGRAQRSARYRHVHLEEKPLAMLLWQLGAEPFTAAAVAWGMPPRRFELEVPGEPRDRVLAFRALTRVAKAFNPWFEGGAGGAPQLVVPNQGNLTLLGRLGRRLSYLPTTGETPADPELVRFGRHLSFLATHSRRPGQQLVVVLTQLLAGHWVTELSPLEAQHLPALDAAIDPPHGQTVYAAVAGAEAISIGPVPGDEDDEELEDLLAAFNVKRRASGGSANAELIGIKKHYQGMVERGWPLISRVLDRERQIEEAPHAARRWEQDLASLQRHFEWVIGKSGRYRAQQTFTQAAHTLHDWEEAQRLFVAEQAIDDALKMLPYILSHEAVTGVVESVDLSHKEKPNVKWVMRPLVRLRTSEPCRIPLGTQLYWTEAADQPGYEVQSIKDDANGSTVVLKQLTGSSKAKRPGSGERATFSVHRTGKPRFLTLPKKAPWTHSPRETATQSIEDAELAGGWE